VFLNNPLRGKNNVEGCDSKNLRGQGSRERAWGTRKGPVIDKSNWLECWGKKCEKEFFRLRKNIEDNRRKGQRGN